ncbi:Ff.00g114580.m01.CDS01 [Fusarium sp. VM40]|nr:Ff.00g114580.m01.CDS01 [Fusarium sp. VM40]
MDQLLRFFQYAQQPIGTASNDPLAQLKHWNKLAEDSYSRYTQTQSLADLEKSIKLYQQAIESSPQLDAINRSGLLSNLSQRLCDRYDRTNMLADLDQAIQTLRQGLDLHHPSRGGMLSNLGIYLAARYDQTREAKDLEEAVRVSRQGVACTPETFPERSNVLFNLGNRLGQRYAQTGHSTDIEEAVQSFRAASASIPSTHANQPTIWGGLALQLGERYSSTGNVADLNEAIAIARQAIDHTPSSDVGRVPRLGTLATLLYHNFKRTGGISDLNEAIRDQKEVIRATPRYDSGRDGSVNNLANMLIARNSRSGELSDVIEAVELMKEAIKNTPDNHVNKAAMLNTLVTALGTKARHTDEEVDRNEAIPMIRQALQLIGHDQPERIRCLHNLALLLEAKSAQPETQTTAELGEAIEVTQQALDAAPSNHPDRAILLCSLGSYVAENYCRTKAPASLVKAKECFISALHHQTSSIKSRIIVGRRFLLFDGILEDLEQACEVASYTVDLIPLLISSSLQQVDKQALLSDAVAIASDAAAIALMHNKPASRAVELLEVGRNVIASSMHDPRSELSTLQEKHPDLANRYSQLQQQPDIPNSHEDISNADNLNGSLPESDQALLADIRTQPGFENFLVTTSPADMQAVASNGPIAIINISKYRCDALIIELSGFQTVPLPAISWDTIIDYKPDTLETSEWLWDGIVLPTLDALGFTKQPSDGHWPHIWWIPTGRLVGYPLHAAGYHMRRSAETALDRVISSYSSSVKTIIHCHRQQGYESQEVGSNRGLALVSMETTPNHPRLEHVAKEVQAVRDLVDSSTALSLTEPMPFKKDVLSALASCSIFHFAGHGGADTKNPFQSLLLLSDWQDDPLTVECVFETNLGHKKPMLAYLSACGTGEIQAVSLVDESIHLAAAFQLSGFQHVIGTLWSVDDRLCVDMARMTYEGLLEGGMRDEAVSRSLHRATRDLRDQWVNSGIANNSSDRKQWLRNFFFLKDTSEVQLNWAPYVHYGV